MCTKALLYLLSVVVPGRMDTRVRLCVHRPVAEWCSKSSALLAMSVVEQTSSCAGFKQLLQALLQCFLFGVIHTAWMCTPELLHRSYDVQLSAAAEVLAWHATHLPVMTCPVHGGMPVNV